PILSSLLVLALVFAVGGVAHSEDAPPPKNEVRLKAKQMSASEQLAIARGVVTRGKDLAQRLMHMVDQARQENDMIRVTCLNDKLTQTNANVNTAESRLEGLSHAADVEARAHEFTVIVVVGMKIQTLDQEANQCVGQDLYEAGATKIQTTVDISMLPF